MQVNVEQNSVFSSLVFNPVSPNVNPRHHETYNTQAKMGEESERIEEQENKSLKLG